MNLSDIMSMLDWNLPSDVQLRGRQLAIECGEIEPFIQPITQMHNKNVWDNCALILSNKSDEELKPYLPELLKWLQDLNWPGSIIVLNRLKHFSFEKLIFPLTQCVSCIDESSDFNQAKWLYNLSELLEISELKLHISKEVLERLTAIRKDFEESYGE